MFNFTLGAVVSGAFKKKIFDYRKSDQLNKLITQKDFEYLLIDLRSEEQYESAHIPTAVSIPFDKLMTSLPVENMFLTIIVYGSNGKISARAAQYLSESGYFNVTSFGSVSRWKGELTRIGMIGETYIEHTEKGRADFPV